MNDQLEARNITIATIEVNQYGFKVKDERGLVYNVSSTKKDGTPTKAFEALSALEANGLNQQKCFKYATVENKQGGQSRYVRIISAPEEIQPQNAPTTYISPKMQSQGNFEPKKAQPETDWDKISWGKCKHAYLVEMFKSHLGVSSDDRIGTDEITLPESMKNYEEIAEEWADMSMRDTRDNKPQTETQQKMAQAEEIPTIEVPVDEIQVADVPF